MPYTLGQFTLHKPRIMIKRKLFQSILYKHNLVKGRGVAHSIFGRQYPTTEQVL